MATGKGVTPAARQTLPPICHTARRCCCCLSNAVVFISHTAPSTDYRSARCSGSQSVSPATGVTDVATGKGIAPAPPRQMLSSLFATPLVAHG
eukprot:scaffold101156_cov29-Attheya_sp.AAC.1